MNTDTALVLILAILALALLVETLREVFHDGPSRQGPPRSHEPDRSFLPPGALPR